MLTITQRICPRRTDDHNNNVTLQVAARPIGALNPGEERSGRSSPNDYYKRTTTTLKTLRNDDNLSLTLSNPFARWLHQHGLLPKRLQRDLPSITLTKPGAPYNEGIHFMMLHLNKDAIKKPVFHLIHQNTKRITLQTAVNLYNMTLEIIEAQKCLNNEGLFTSSPEISFGMNVGGFNCGFLEPYLKEAIQSAKLFHPHFEVFCREEEKQISPHQVSAACFSSFNHFDYSAEISSIVWNEMEDLMRASKKNFDPLFDMVERVEIGKSRGLQIHFKKGYSLLNILEHPLASEFMDVISIALTKVQETVHQCFYPDTDFKKILEKLQAVDEDHPMSEGVFNELNKYKEGNSPEEAMALFSSLGFEYEELGKKLLPYYIKRLALEKRILEGDLASLDEEALRNEIHKMEILPNEMFYKMGAAAFKLRESFNEDPSEISVRLTIASTCTSGLKPFAELAGEIDLRRRPDDMTEDEAKQKATQITKQREESARTWLDLALRHGWITRHQITQVGRYVLDNYKPLAGLTSDDIAA